MSKKVLNRVQMNVSGTPGTGDVTLGAATSGFQSFAAGGAVDGDVIPYLIQEGVNWEIGRATYVAAGTKLQRTVLQSSNANAAVAFTAGAVVSCIDVARTTVSTVASTDEVVMEGGAKVSLSTLADFFRNDFTLVKYDTTLPSGTTFTRSTAAYAQDLNFSPVQFAAGSPRITRRGLFASDVAISANLLANPDAPATQSVTLTAGTYTLQAWGMTSVAVTGASGAVGAATPGNPLTWTATAGSHTLTITGVASRFQLKAESVPSQYSIAAVAAESCIIPSPAGWTGHTEHGIWLSGMLRQIGVAQALALSWADGSYLRAKRNTAGKWLLEYTVDGATMAGPVGSVVFPGIGADLVLTCNVNEARLWCNGTMVAAIAMPRALTGPFSLAAHEWRSFIYRATAYRGTTLPLQRVRPASHYELPDFFPRDPGTPIRRLESNWTKSSTRMTCAVAGTLDLFLNYNQEGFSVGQSVVISFWDGGAVGGINPHGQTYVVESQQAGTGTADRRVRFTVAGAVVSSTIVYGTMVTVSTGYQSAKVHVLNSSNGSNFLTRQSLKLGDTVVIEGMSQGTTHGGVNLSGLTLTLDSGGRLAGATGGTGLITIHGGIMKCKITRVGSGGSARLPCIVDLDSYTATDEDKLMPPYNPATDLMYASGAYTPNSSSISMSTSAGAYCPASNVDIIVVGRTKADHYHPGITGSDSKIAGVFYIGGVYLQPAVGAQDHCGDMIYSEGVRMDNVYGVRSEADLWYIRSRTANNPVWRVLNYNFEGLNTGGTVGGNHSDGMQINGATLCPAGVHWACRGWFTGTYQAIGFWANQLGYASAADDVTYGKYRRAMRGIRSVQASQPPGEALGYNALWFIDASIGPNGFGAGGGNAASPFHINNLYAMPTPATPTFDGLFFRKTSGGVGSLYVENLFDRVTGVQQTVNMTLAADGQSGKLPHAIGGKGNGMFSGYLPDGLWPTDHFKSGGLAIPGRYYQSPIAAFADGYFAGPSQIPYAYRNNMPVDFDWQSSNITGTTVTLWLFNPDPYNPITALKVYRSLVPSGVSSGFSAYELPEAGIPGANLLQTISGDPFSGYHSYSVTDTLSSGQAAYYRLGTVRADGTEAISSMWSARAA